MNLMGRVQNNIKIRPSNKCCLFLFTPKKISNAFVRPLSYNFNQELTHSIYNSVMKNTTTKSVINSHSANRSIVPSSNGVHMNTSFLSSHWSFVLIVDVENNQSPIGESLPSRFSNMRFIYSGYCTDEPINRNTIDLPSPTINDQCTLRITRKVIINKLRQRIGSTGVKTRDNVIDDIIVAKYDKRIVGDASLFSMAPNSALNSVFDPSEGKFAQHVSVLSTDDSLNVKESIGMQSSLQSPKSHMTSITKSIKNGVDDIIYEGSLGSYDHSGNQSFDELNNDDGTYISDVVMNNVNADLSYKHEVTDVDGSGIFGLNSAYDLYIQDIKSKYDPDIYVIKNQNKSLSIIPQDYLSVETIFSSLISSCVPSYAVNSNLSSVAFGYDSYRDAVEVFHFDSPAVCSQDELLSRWNKFMYLFRKELVPIVKDNGGEFHLLVNCSTSNSTISKLQFYDNGRVFGSEDYYEHSNILGGLNSNALGTATALSKNGIMLNNLIGNVTSMSLGSGDHP